METKQLELLRNYIFDAELNQPKTFLSERFITWVDNIHNDKETLKQLGEELNSILRVHDKQ
jgi:hypothetical protein